MGTGVREFGQTSRAGTCCGENYAGDLELEGEIVPRPALPSEIESVVPLLVRRPIAREFVWSRGGTDGRRSCSTFEIHLVVRRCRRPQWYEAVRRRHSERRE